MTLSIPLMLISISYLLQKYDSIDRVLYLLFNKSGHMLLFVNGLFCISYVGYNFLVKIMFNETRLIEGEVITVLILVSKRKCIQFNNNFTLHIDRHRRRILK